MRMGDVIDPPSVAQVSQAFDDSVSQEVTNHLFQGDPLTTIHNLTEFLSTFPQNPEQGLEWTWSR